MGLNEFFEGLSAVATAGALVTAVYAGLQARRLYRIESDRDEHARAAARASQAIKISAWAATRIRTGGRALFGVVVRNSSDGPVYDVQVM